MLWMWSVVIAVAIVVVAGHDIDCSDYNLDCQQCIVEGCHFCREKASNTVVTCQSSCIPVLQSEEKCRPDPNFDKTKSCEQVRRLSAGDPFDICVVVHRLL
jgi:hypothetical protein